jgi:hypothetical protein
VQYALLFLPALVAIAYVGARWRRPQVLAEETAVVEPVELHEPEPVAELEPQPVVLTEAIPEPVAQISGEADPLQALETLLAELERATLDERDVEELERLAEQLEATAAALQQVP